MAKSPWLDHKRNNCLLKELKTMHTGTFQNIKPNGLELKCQQNGKEHICGTGRKILKNKIS
jgi:hypothetical protein